MLVKLIGKEHISGISKKTNKPFEANIAHILRPDKKVDGMIGDRVMLNVTDYPLDTLVLNANYNLEYNARGFVDSFVLSK